MPSADQHRHKAERNRTFLGTIPIDDYPEWVVVVSFYTAVHHVERLRAAAGDGDSTGHEDRLHYVQHRHPAIHSAYHVLQNASMLARYQAVGTFFAQFQPEDVEAQLLGRLKKIDAYVTAQLG